MRIDLKLRPNRQQQLAANVWLAKELCTTMRRIFEQNFDAKTTKQRSKDNET
jgi:hypothetical protein